MPKFSLNQTVVTFDRGYLPDVPLNTPGSITHVYEEGELPGKKRDQGYEVRVINTDSEEVELFFYENELLSLSSSEK